MTDQGPNFCDSLEEKRKKIEREQREKKQISLPDFVFEDFSMALSLLKFLKELRQRMCYLLKHIMPYKLERTSFLKEAVTDISNHIQAIEQVIRDYHGSHPKYRSSKRLQEEVQQKIEEERKYRVYKDFIKRVDNLIEEFEKKLNLPSSKR